MRENTRRPRAIGADQRDDFALTNMQADVMQRLDLAVVRANVVNG